MKTAFLPKAHRADAARRLLQGLSFAALGLIAVGCGMERFTSLERGVTVERFFLERPHGTEVFLFKPPGPGPFPGVVLFHGDQPAPTGRLGGREFFLDGTGEFLASQGYVVIAPSMPGFGDSPGLPDFVGPETMAALRAAVVLFRRMPVVDPHRLVLYGASRGATAAVMLARDIPGVQGLILQSGVYDLTQFVKETPIGDPPTEAQLEFRKSIEREAGLSARDLRLRSPALQPPALTYPVLVIHGKEDQVVPVLQMQAFVERLRKDLGDKGEIVSREVEGGHVVSGAIAWSEALPFLERCLKDRSVARNGPLPR